MDCCKILDYLFTILIKIANELILGYLLNITVYVAVALTTLFFQRWDY